MYANHRDKNPVFYATGQRLRRLPPELENLLGA